VERNSANSQSIIRQVDSTGNVSTLLTTALYNIQAIACDNGGQKYVAFGSSFSNNTACQISKLSNAGTLMAWCNNPCGYLDNTTPSLARFSGIKFIGFDNNNNLYIADEHRIRKISISTNLVTTLAGTGVAGFRDGQADSAKFNNPNSIAVENDGTIYISDKDNNFIRKLSGGVVSTIAGTPGPPNFNNTGTALTSGLSNPRTVLTDYAGHLYILESVPCIRQITPAAGSIKILAGHFADPDSTNGLPLIARFNNPNSLTYDKVTGTLYIADMGNNKIRKISFE
jgi:hypothetical protein